MFTQLLSGHTVTFNGAFICLEDSGKGRSITNGAEDVIRHLETALAAHGLDMDRYAVIYRDTMGNWDQLLTRDGRFAGFKSLGGTADLETAKARASVPVSTE
jgi:hypothetical protein